MKTRKLPKFVLCQMCGKEQAKKIFKVAQIEFKFCVDCWGRMNVIGGLVKGPFDNETLISIIGMVSAIVEKPSKGI